MRILRLLSVCVLSLAAFEGQAAAQAVVEYATGAGVGATAAAASKSAGNSIAGAFDSVNKSIKQAQSQTPGVETVTVVSPASSVPAPATRPAKSKAAVLKEAPSPARIEPVAPRPSYEDAMGVQKGMSCEEVVRRFGPPSMSFASEDNANTMSYASVAGGVQVECVAGKVTSVDKPKL